MTESDKDINWFEKFIVTLANLLKEPPYHLFVFIGTIFVFVTLILQKYLEQAVIFFLYSVAGIMWRYAEKDFVSPFKKLPNSKLWIRTIYHIGNFSLFFVLLYYLKKFI
jgi:hypothetical protein